MCNASEKLTDQHTYAVMATLQTYSEQARWARLNTFLVLESLLFAGWTTMNLRGGEIAGKDVLLILFSLLGICLGIVWSILGYRTSRYHNALQEFAAELEKKSNVDGPFRVIKRIRDFGPKSGGAFSSANWIVVWVPILLALLFLVALWLSVPCR